MDEGVWREYVKAYNGAFVLWIDQSTDPLLKANNSAGVCFAMALDFVTAYQMGQPGPGLVVNEIRDAKLVPPGTNRIPAKYLDIQQIAEAMLKQYNENVTQLVVQIKQAEKDDKPALKTTLKQLKDDRIKQKFGPGMDASITFKEDVGELAPLRIFMEMSDIVTAKGPSYFFLSMRRQGGRHAVAFGFRPDLNASSNFPGIFEYFDANLGLFVFGTAQKLEDFFDKKVWEGIYLKKNYTEFEIVSFTAHRGRR